MLEIITVLSTDVYLSYNPTLLVETAVVCMHDDDYSGLSPDEIVIILSDKGDIQEHTFYRQD